MIYVAFSCYSSCEFDGPPTGLLKLDRALADHILKEVEFAQGVIAQKKVGIAGIHLWSGAMEWFTWTELLEDHYPGDKDFQKIIEETGHVVLPHDKGFPEEHGLRSEVQQLVVTGSEFYWNAYQKHTNVRFETQCISTEAFKELVKQLSAGEQQRIIP